MSKYMVLVSYTTNSEYDGYTDIYTGLNVIGVTAEFDKIKELAEEDLNDVAHDYANGFDLDEDDPDDMAEYEEHIDDYVAKMEHRGTLVESELAVNIPTLFMSNDFDDGSSIERSEYYVIKLEG